jgi:hypothetical protein
VSFLGIGGDAEVLHQHGEALKMAGSDGHGKEIRFCFYAVVMMQDRVPLTNKGALPVFQTATVLDSARNAYVWAGPSSWPGITFVELPEFADQPNGAKVLVPAEFQLDKRDANGKRVCDLVHVVPLAQLTNGTPPPPPPAPDQDGDGHPDHADNCPVVANVTSGHRR